MENKDKTFSPAWLKDSSTGDASDSDTFQSIIKYYYTENDVAKVDLEQFLKKQIQAQSDENSLKKKNVDIVIIVAIPDEKDGAYSAFGLSKGMPRKTDLLDQFHFAYQQFEHNGLNIVLLIQPFMGMTHSSSLTTRAILGFHPKLVAMVGICAGREEKTHLGDIIIASSVFDYTAGRQYVDRFGPRPKSYPIDNTIAEFVVDSVIDNHELLGKIMDGFQGAKPRNQITIQFKPLASGTAVIDDPKVMEEIVRSQDDLAGIDMESYAVAVSSNILRTKWIIIKTVQDFADGEKEKTEGGIRNFAAYSSAKLLELILGDLSNYI